ncbi:MAG: ABC transporter permease [Ardenticatenaceae bacterium]|nr:ABC transporter permease [Ardenticatenaceae bacterium]
MKESIPSLDASPPAPGTSLSTLDYIRNYLLRLRSGEIGSWPMILGLMVIALIFQSQNQNFLTARNFVNLIVQMAGYTVIAIGVVYVLLVGEIDLSIGYVSAVAAVFMVLQLQDPPGWPWYAAVSVALMLAATIGILHGLIITTFQVPSFIVSLAALIAWNGTVLLLIGTSGTVIIQDNVIVGIANHFLEPALGWLVGIVTIVIFAFYQIQHWVVRRRQRLVDVPGIIVLMRIVLLAGLASGVVFICNQDRGVPFVGVLLLILLTGFTVLATKTRFGRYVYAIGDNKIAARRAGIDVKRVLITVFMISSLMAGAGGIVLASRLRSVDTAAGGGNLLLNSIAAAVIGGTSLFGGSGRVPNVLLGALVIASVENGMGLLRLDAGVQFIITGFVLLMAVLVDAVSRQNRRQPVQS